MLCKAPHPFKLLPSPEISCADRSSHARSLPLPTLRHLPQGNSDAHAVVNDQYRQKARYVLFEILEPQFDWARQRCLSDAPGFRLFGHQRLTWSSLHLLFRQHRLSSKYGPKT